MASIKYTNNAKTTLAADLNNSATSATVVNGNLFPSLSSGEHFYCTFDDGTNTEIVKVTARSTHVLTIVRAQDNTSARAFSSGDKAELRITAVVLEEVSTSSSSWNTDIFAGDGSDTTFTLTQAATDEKYLQVYIDGAFQAHNTYSVSGTTLTFATAPANSRVITVYHIEPVALGTATGATITANNSANETVFPVFVDGATGTQGLETDTGFTYNPSSGVLTIAGELDAGSLDVSGNADIDGTLEADAITINGVTLAETISDTVGAMVSSNTETGIAVTYDDSDNTLDFVIGADVIVQSMVADNAIDSQHYVDGSIDVAHMSANSIDSDQYVDGSIDTAHIADSQITVAKMAANSVDSDQYVDGSIDTAHIADSQITSAKIADGTIATADIADNAITLAKMASGTDGNIISFDASGNPVAIATGSDGQVLTSTGAGSPPAFEDAAGGGPTFKAFGTGSIMVGDDATGTINAADNNTGLGVDVFAALTSGDDNVAVGFSAAKALTTGVRNVFIGEEAGSVGTTTSYSVGIGRESLKNATGDNNTAVGYVALKGLTSGTNNTAVGRSAMTGVVTGQYNSVLGYGAGAAITSGDYNVAIGGLSLDANTTGGGNVALGTSALGANTTADGNTALGNDALAVNTTGTYNTAVGLSALDANTTGNLNTAVGWHAATAVTTGVQNTAVGEQALSGVTTTNNNTAVGYRAMTAAGAAECTGLGTQALNACTGSENTAVGWQSGVNVSSGSSNVMMGYQAGKTCTTGHSNVLLGNHTMYNGTEGNHNTCVGINAGYHIGNGYRNVAIGTSISIPNNSNHRFAIGYNNAGGSNTQDHALSVHSGGTNYVRLLTGSTTVSANSDERLKKDIEDLTYGLSFINRLRPVNYKLKVNSELPEVWKDDEVEDVDMGWMNGFLAQEVKTALDAESIPAEKVELWSEDAENHGLQSLGEAALIPMLVKALQEADDKIDALTARIETLEG